MTISTDKIRDLREKTGAGMMDCKKALVETKGDIEKAIEFLRKAGLSAASKRSGKIASEGLVHSYIHGNGKIGVLLEVNCETDFVARTDDFKQFTNDLGLQIAASNPHYVSKEEVPGDVLEKEKEILRERALKSGKPEKIVDKIVDGQLNKFYEEVCLLNQPFVKDPNQTIEELLKSLIAKLGENVKIRRFVRYQRGEGLEKRSTDLAAEIAEQLKK
ncbi:translation elongation factor Ts [Bdellovibrionota bacterium]